ncbi:MAG: HAD family phosphatase [Saprospiraceae bacterium]|nr:HAD family phosphatase [Saprospiraceae bacterium]MCB9324053.1 HAD family phosphatase [Lewinellaceae bacterium]
MIETVIFDLGGVLIDWNPRYVYREIFENEEQMEHFLTEICGDSWNKAQDAGRPIAEGNQLLIDQYPEYKTEILTFYERWVEMLGGPIHETVDILRTLHSNGKARLVALTNWSAETFPIAQSMYDFLGLFEGILVSGEENLVKPDPKIYELLLDRYDINRSKAVFIDDNKDNIIAANNLGLEGWHFTSPQQLRGQLKKRGLL